VLVRGGGDCGTSLGEASFAEDGGKKGRGGGDSVGSGGGK
jgi:hypothetical protein